jgi:D-galactarolactone cycloisomerase
MKIVGIDPVLCALPIRASATAPARLGTQADMLLVRVRTDEGLVGWGEIFALGQSWRPALTALQTTVAPRCIARDPRDIQALTRELTYHIHQLGRSGSVMQAWSGVELALWDLLGKSLGVPLHRLLGGAQVERLATYASLPRYGSAAPVREQAGAALQRGFRGVKLHECDPDIVRASWPMISEAGAQLMLDVNAEWTPQEAREALKALSEVDLRWLEEPLKPADGYEALASLRATTGVAVAAGEAVSSISDFKLALQLGALDVVQPSPSKIGGLGAMRRVVEWVADSGVELAPHTPQFGPALLASLHLCAALAPHALQERFFVDLQISPFGAAVEPCDGWLSVPQGPGLGCDPDPDALARCRVG